MQEKKVKLTIELVIKMLNEGHKVYDIARLTGKREYSVRYLLRKHGCYRKVSWVCPDYSVSQPTQGE